MMIAMEQTQPDSEPLRRGAAARLAAAGHLPDPRWQRVAEVFPREEFVPGVWVPYASPPPGAAPPQAADPAIADTAADTAADGPRVWTYLDGSDPVHRAAWLHEVYSGTPLVIRLAAAAPHGADTVTGDVEIATVSVTRYLAALHALELAPGQRVLELGLGAGIGAGMIAAYLNGPVPSAPAVVAVEIDPHLAASTTTRLDRHRYRVEIHVADALAPDLATRLGAVPDHCSGMPRADEHGDARPEFDRIIATFPVSEPPAEWLSLLAPGGRLVAFAGEHGDIVVHERAANGAPAPAAAR